MAVLRLALVIVTSVFASACTGESNPVAPTAPTATNLSISGVDAVRTGLFTNYTATATLSDGTTRTVTPTWTSSHTGVASVDSAGRLVGLAHGSTNLTASHEGRSASKTVQVVNNYEGNWTGSYVIRACDDSGIYQDGIYAPPYEDVPYCQVHHRVGSVHSFELALTQMGSNLSEIRGTVPWGVGELTGVVTADGRLNLRGTLNLMDWYGEIVGATFHVGAWDTNLSGPGVMTGRWSENLVAVIGVGNVYTENELVTLTQTSTSSTSASTAR
jgi:hypothetical protein